MTYVLQERNPLGRNSWTTYVLRSQAGFWLKLLGTWARIPVPGLEMQHAILLICFASSFANTSKVLLPENANRGSRRPGIYELSQYNVGRVLLERDQVVIGKLPEYQVPTLKNKIYRFYRMFHSWIP